MNLFQSPGERLHATEGDVPPVLGIYRSLQGCACQGEAAGPRCLTCTLTRGSGSWPKIGNCEWRDVGPCYWVGLG